MTTHLETHTIHPIPHTHRYGRVADLFSVWFSANMTLLTVVTGALGPAVFGLSFFWSVLALLLGNMVGAIFMALHAAQGPRLGVPQMVQSRGQFGIYGSVPIILLVVLMYIGFAASNCVVGGGALAHVLPVFNGSKGVWLVAILTLVPCVMGYRAIHICSRFASWVSIIAVVYAIGCGLGGFSRSLLADTHGSLAGFFGAFSVSALWQIAYAPYVSDSSRYLPDEASSGRRAFWATYGGTVIGAVLPMVLGSLLSLSYPSLPLAGALAHAGGRVGNLVVLVLALAIPLANAMSVYCGALCSLTLVQTFRPAWRSGLGGRLLMTFLLLAIALIMSLGMMGDFLKAYTSFLDILMAVLVPWTSINLCDYYILRDGQYDVAAFFAADGGPYGRFNGLAVAVYVLGVFVELPFMKTGPYTGPLVPLLHGVDISWIVSLIVTGGAYYGLVRHLQRKA
ncbi:purine-cytosine permease family protein [Bombella pollinis]|uniref:Cytosine permease n=1 Tax=Bombella pollinis TaxID=2967337 RepID=A0ABT3WID1_9PROT|nr:cytosine permease [Bombella pollinis]MCX5618847.1 cytosine permease [Bombella pollinis]